MTALIKENSGKTYLHPEYPFVCRHHSNQATVAAAYLMMVQGYFIKPNSVAELGTMLRLIIEYWKVCKHPNSETGLF